MDKRIVITGVGAVTPLGLDVESTWQGLLAGRSGVGNITRFDASGIDVQLAAEVKGFDPLKYFDKREAKRTDAFAQYAWAAAKEALDMSGLDLERIPPRRVGVVIGSGVGGINTWEQQHTTLIQRGPSRVSPFFIPMMIIDMAAGMVAMKTGARGPNYAVVSACASGSHAIINGVAHLLREDAEVMICGGAEAAVSILCISGFSSMKALSRRNDDPEHASRPFDRQRDGFVVAEGAGVLVMETYEHAKARGAEILGELAGFAASGDAYHMTAPHPEGIGAVEAMQRALELAGISPEDVDYINAHGTSTQMNDKIETQAIKTVFKDHAYKLAVNSSKSMLGHMLGAGGAVEAVIVMRSLLEQKLHPTVNLEDPDPECDLDYVSDGPREAELEYAMSNSFGFGGHNAVLLFKRFKG